jgi:hypothetical protein
MDTTHENALLLVRTKNFPYNTFKKRKMGQKLLRIFIPDKALNAALAENRKFNQCQLEHSHVLNF